MNLNLINLDCTEWSRSDWQDAYAQYCQHNMFGPKTKKEYYDFVNERFKRLKMLAKPISPDLLRQWSAGRRNARLWAKKHGCDMNGQLLVDIEPKKRNNDALEIALRAEDIAWDTQQRLEYLIERVRK